MFLGSLSFLFLALFHQRPDRSGQLVDFGQIFIQNILSTTSFTVQLQHFRNCFLCIFKVLLFQTGNHFVSLFHNHFKRQHLFLCLLFFSDCKDNQNGGRMKRTVLFFLYLLTLPPQIHVLI